MARPPGTVIHIPHASSAIPAHYRGGICLDDDSLADELMQITDWFTDRLFSVPAELAETIRFPVSRLVLDPERFVDDACEPMAARGMGVVYTRTTGGDVLRTDLSDQERQQLIDELYIPHHRALAAATQESLDRHARCLIIDGHSFPLVPLPCHAGQDANRPDICIGTDPFHTPAWLTELAVKTYRSLGFSVKVNDPFAGSLVPELFYKKDRRVLSFMIELNRDLYMDEATGRERPDFDRFRERNAEAVSKIIRTTFNTTDSGGGLLPATYRC